MNVMPIKRMVIEEDSINTVRFIVPKAYDGHDLTSATWYISLIADGTIGDMIELVSHEYSVTKLYVDWFLTGAATARSGDLDFAIRAEVGIYVYQTYTQTITIDSKLDLTGTEEFTPSILQVYRDEFEALKEDAETARAGAELAEEHAELAEIGAEQARDAILLDTGFQAVASNIDNIIAVAENEDNINAVHGNKAHIDTVANDIANVVAVGENIASVVTVAGMEGDISTVVENIVDIQNAEEHAQLAKDYATKPVDEEVEPGTYSAKHWATKAHDTVVQALADAFEVVTIDEEEYLIYTY